jgi:hypothetical protein
MLRVRMLRKADLSHSTPALIAARHPGHKGEGPTLS